MAAIGKSQKRKNKITTICMVFFFSVLAILIIIPVYAIFIASFKPGNDLLQYGLNLNLDWEKMTLDMVWKQSFAYSDYSSVDFVGKFFCSLWFCCL